MDFGIAAPITRRLHREVDRAAFGYLPRDLKAEMREATTAFLRERTGWEVDPRDVHEMPDVIAVLQAAMDSFTRPGAKITVPTPAYMPFLSVPGLRGQIRSEEHTSELQSRGHLVCRLLLEKKKQLDYNVVSL